MVNRRGRAACWGRTGQGCKNLATTRACRALQSLQEPGPYFSPCLLGRGCVVQQRREAERAGLPAGLSALAHPLSSSAGRGLQRGQCAHGVACSRSRLKNCRESLWSQPTAIVQGTDWVPQGLASTACTPPYQQLCTVSHSPCPALLALERVMCAKI